MEKQKNILFLSSWYPSKNHSTLGNFVQYHAEAIATLNNVYVLYLAPDDNFKKAVHIDNSLRNRVDTTIVYFKRNKLKYLNYFKALKKGLNYLTNVRDIHFDCIHMNVMLPSGWQAIYIKRKLNIPYIISEHWHGYQNLSKFKINLLQKIILKNVIKNASFICPVTTQLKKAIESSGYEGNYKIIPNVVNVDKFKQISSPNKTKFTFLHVSTLVDEIKNISGILKAFNKLEQKENILLRIIGDGETDWIGEKAKSLNIPEESILIEKEKTHDEIATAMQESDVFVLFSNIENLPLVLIEAMASGLPIITSNVGGILEHINSSTGIVIEPKDINALTESMNKMILTHSQYNSDLIREYAVNYFSFPVISNQFNNLYNRALEKPKMN